jgi:hypothetical protein
MSTLTNDLARLATSANVLVSAITVNSSSITSVNVGGVAINSSGLSGPVTFSNNVTITGNLTVTGSTMYVNTTVLDVKDLNITIAKGAASAAAANGAGLTIDGASATMLYDSSIDDFVFNKGVKSVDLTTTTNTATIGTAVYSVANGNFGIGTSTPLYRLHIGSYVNSNSQNKLAIGEYAGYQGLIYYNSGDEGFTLENTSTYAGGSINFKINSTERVRIDSAGRVGIGTSTPNDKLTIYGANTVYSDTVSGGASGTNSDWAYHKVTVGGTYSGSLYNLIYGGGIGYTYYSSNNGQYWVGTSQNSPLILYTNNAARMRITSTGYIGIGTTSPSYPLVVSDAGAKGIEFIPNAEANTSQILSYNRSGAVWTNLRYVAEKHEFYFRNTEIFTANSTILSLSGLQGIKFQASQSASSDANTLDDYEEGTWTPTYLGSTSNPTVSYSEQLGSYIKIGRLVVCFVKIVKSSASGGSGSLMLGGLPFTASSPGYGMASRIMSWSWHPASPDYKADQLYVNQGSTTAMVWDVATNTITVATMVAGIGTIITGMFSYYTSA